MFLLSTGLNVLPEQVSMTAVHATDGARTEVWLVWCRAPRVLRFHGKSIHATMLGVQELHLAGHGERYISSAAPT